MFAGIPGQAQAKAFFSRALRDGTLSHAYLLGRSRGPRQDGVRARARRRAGQWLRQLRRVPGVRARPPWGFIRTCHVLEREGDVWRIGQVKAIVADLSLKPFSAAHRVWVIPEIEYMNRESANKFLKSLEEPPSYVVFLLVTDRLDRVLPTIRSRCQVVEFRPLSDTEVASLSGRALGRGHGRGRGARAALVRIGGEGCADGCGRGRAGPPRGVPQVRGGRRGRRRPQDGPAPADAFLGVLRASRPRSPRRSRRIWKPGSQSSNGSSRTRRTSSGTWSRRRNAPSARLAVASGSPPRTRSTCSSRGCATSGWSLPGIRCTLEQRPPRRARRWGRGDAGALRSSSGRRRQDSQGPVSQYRPEARVPGYVRALRGGPDQCLGSAASCSAAAAGSTSSAPAELSSLRATASSSTPRAARDFGRLVKGPDEVADDAPRAASARCCAKPRPPTSRRSPLTANGVPGEERMPPVCRRPQARRQGRRGAPGVRRPSCTITFFAEERTDARELQSKLGDRLSRRVELKQVSARTSRASSAATDPAAAASAAPRSRRSGAGLHPHGQGSESAAQPHQDQRCCRRLMCCLKYEHQVTSRSANGRPNAGDGRTSAGKERSQICWPRSTASPSPSARAARRPSSSTSWSAPHRKD